MVARSLLALLLCCCVARVASAADESFLVSQRPAGSVEISLLGEIRYCDALFAGFAGAPLVAVSAQQVTISTDVWGGECSPPPDPPPAPVPYTESADAGVLPDGDYVVTWTWHTINFPMPDQSFTTRFALAGGELLIFRDGFEAAPARAVP